MNGGRKFFIELSNVFGFKRINISLMRSVAVPGLSVLIILSLVLPSVSDAVTFVKAAEMDGVTDLSNIEVLNVLTKSAEKTYSKIRNTYSIRPPNPQTVATHKNTASRIHFNGGRLSNVNTDQSFRSSPIMFIENVGQFDPAARFQLRGAGGTIYLAPDAIWITIMEPLSTTHGVGDTFDPSIIESPRAGVNLRLSFVGANTNAQIVGFDPLDTNVSYLKGSDPSQSYSDVPVWGGVRYEEIYPGVDLEITSDHSQWLWQMVVSDIAKLTPVALQIEGANSLILGERSLDITTYVQDIGIPLLNIKGISDPGIVIPTLTGEQINQPFNTLDTGGEYIQNQALSSETTYSGYGLYYSRYLGGSSYDFDSSIAVDSFGAVYITGMTYSQNFPFTPGAFQELYGGNYDAFTTKLSADGRNLIYSTFLGGSGQDKGGDIAVDQKTGEAYLIGDTISDDFPIDDCTYYSGKDIFVIKLNKFGTEILNGICIDISTTSEYIDIDEDDAVYIASHTYIDAQYDIYAAKLSPDGNGWFTILYSTIFGGVENDETVDIAVDTNGFAHITGVTGSDDFPVTNNSVCGGCPTSSDGFVARLDPEGAIEFATYLGGNSKDWGSSINVDEFGQIYIGGGTISDNFPTTPGAFDEIFDGGTCGEPPDTYVCADDFVTIFNPQGTIKYSSYIGGNFHEEGVSGIDVDLNGWVYITGDTSSATFPRSDDAFQKNCNNCSEDAFDGFFSIFNSTLSGLIYSTYIGGSDDDVPLGIAVANKIAYITGETESTDFPRSPWAGSYNGGGEDVFVSSFGMQLPNISVYNFSNNEFCAAYEGALGKVGEPINTHTGGYDYSTLDLSIQTAAGPLEFKRWYSSLTTDTYTTTLGYGWTHSLDTRLIFPDDPGGMQGRVLIKAHSANQYEFLIDGIYTDTYTGTFSAYPGLCASLVGNVQNNQVISYTVTDQTQKRYIFDADGKALQIVDPQGHFLIYEYEPSTGRLDRVRDESGLRFLDITYDPSTGFITSLADQDNRTVGFQYDITTGDLLTMTDVLDQNWYYNYDLTDPHLLTEVRDPQEEIIERTVYSNGLAVEQYNGEGERVVALDYGIGITTTVTDGLENQSIHYYDGRGTLTDITYPLTGTLTKSYNHTFHPTSITDPLTHTTYLTWSEDGANLTQTVAVLDSGVHLTTTLDYDDLNNLTSVVDPRGNTTTFTYSGTLLTSSTNPTEDTTTYTYDENDFLESVTDPLTNTTFYDYDAGGQLRTITDALTSTTSFDYDNLGRLNKITYPSGRRVDWTCYDDAGRVVRTVSNATGLDPCNPSYQPSLNPDEDQIVDTMYDVRGNPIATIEWLVEAGGILTRTTRTYYDLASRPITVVQNLSGWPIELPTAPPCDADHPDQNVCSFNVYDNAGNLIKTIDNAGHVTRYCYDDLNRVVKTVYNPTTGDPCGTYTPSGNPDEDVIHETVYDRAGNVIASIDPLGRITRTYYDELNRPKTVVSNLTGQPITDSDPPARNPNVPDENVRTDTYYDKNGNVIQTIDNAENVDFYCYDPANRLVKTVLNPTVGDPCGTYNPSSEADQDVIHTTIYDGNGNPIASIDPLGIITRSYYDPLNRPWLVVRNVAAQYIYSKTPPVCNRGNGDEYVCTETIYDDETGNPIASIDPLGIITRTYYDELDRPVLVVRNLTNWDEHYLDPPPINLYGNEENVATETRYESSGSAIASIDWLVEAGTPISITTRTYYDELSRPITVVQNLSGQSIYEPSAPDFIPAFPERNVRTETVYDGIGNAIASIAWTADEYDVIVKHVTRSYYDKLNRVRLVVENLSPNHDITDPVPPTCNRDISGSTEPYNVCREMIYDRNGNVIASIDPLERITRSYYDKLNRPESVVSNLVGQTIYIPEPPARNPNIPDENVRTDFGYDAAGNQTSVTDPNAITTSYGYDALNRLVSVIENYSTASPSNEANVRTEYTYDKDGNLIRIRDGNATLSGLYNYTIYRYDDLNRLTRETDPLNHEWVHTYDVAGNRVSTLDANGETTNFIYDALNRLKETDYVQESTSVSFAYNALGWRTGMTDTLGITTWMYDPLGRPLTITNPLTGTVSYDYDALGNRKALIYPDGKIVSYRYDGLDRLNRATDWDSQITSYIYDVSNNPIAIVRPNGVNTLHSYDALNRVEGITNTLNGDLLSFFDYTYDPAGNRINATERVRNPGEPLDLIFADGFESGDFSAWSYHTESNELEVLESAALTGTYGMSAYVDDGTYKQVRDDTPDAEPTYHVRFYFDASQAQLASGFQFQMFQVRSGDTPMIKMHYRRSGSYYYVQPYVRADGGTWYGGTSYAINQIVPHAIEISWSAASAAGANNGTFEFWVDGTLRYSKTNLDNDTHRIDQAFLMATGQVGYQGTYCFDAFESRSDSAIGLLNGVHGCGTSPEFWEPLSPEALLPIIPFTDTLEITGTIATITTTLPVTLTNLEQGGQVAVITSTETVTITGTISPTEAISGTGWVRTRGLASMLPPRWLMAPLGLNGGDMGTSLLMNIDYIYDPLYRLTDAIYNGGYYRFEFTYDAVGNRTQMVSHMPSGQVLTTNYIYDFANRLASVDGVNYTWDNNGNLLHDGLNNYTYDQANRLISMVNMPPGVMFTYNGLGDRMQQNYAGNTTTYLLDLAFGLTQVLADGESTYMYGLGRIGEEGGAGWQYHLGDALGSVRQLTDPSGAATLAKSYRPYGDDLSSAGSAKTPYGFTGEWTDYTGLIYLRARYYQATVGRFISRDGWGSNRRTPMSSNGWLYAYANPVNLVDPSGHDPLWCDSQLNSDLCRQDYNASNTSTSPLTWQQWTLAKQNARLFDLPPELVAGTIAVEIEHDTDWYDYYLDIYLQQLPLILHYTNPCHFSTVWFHEAADIFLAGYENYFGLLGGRGPGNGIANIHILTAKRVEEYFVENYPGSSLLQPAPDIYYRMTVLLTDKGNIRYTAAILRQLADLRTGVQSSHTNDLDDTDMEVIYSAFRAYLPYCYDSLIDFQEATASPTACFGYQIRPYLEQYRRLSND